MKAPARDPILSYHLLSSHTYASVRRRDRYLDWDNEPSVFKSYPEAPRIPFPREIPLPTRSLWECLDLCPTGPAGQGRLGLAELAALSEGSYGITAVKRYPEGSYSLRAAPSAGALFPIEVYWIVADSEGLPTGVYHYAVELRALECLREGDWRPQVAAAVGEPSLRWASAIAILAAIFWRSAWKYEERAYRYCLLDAGHLAENIRLLGVALGYRPVLRAHFADADLNALLGLDGEREAALILVPLKQEASAPPDRRAPSPPSKGNRDPDEPRVAPVLSVEPPARDLPESAIEAPPCSPAEEVDPRILEPHRATSLAAPPSPAGPAHPTIGKLAAEPLEGLAPEATPGAQAIMLPLPPLPPAPLAETLRRRRSSHDFRREEITLPDLSAILSAAWQPLPSDFPAGGSLGLNACHLIVSAVEGIPSGHLRYIPENPRIHPPEAPRLHLVRAGPMRSRAEYLSLEQSLAGNASLVATLVADLKGIIEGGWPRGYRCAHLEAGAIGQRIYLAATALGLGATGIGAFFDRELGEFLGVQEAGGAVLYELAVGHPDR